LVFIINQNYAFKIGNYPHPDLPPRGKEKKIPISPLGETGKGVQVNKTNKTKLSKYFNK
jgi:hypothetical protein